MAFEMKPNSGSIFEADKDGNEARPDMKGKARIGDMAVWVSGWWNTTRAGDPFLALKFEEMTEEQVEKYLPEHVRSATRPPPNRAGTRDNSALIASVQERAKQMAERNKQRLPPAAGFKDDIPYDDDIPF